MTRWLVFGDDWGAHPSTTQHLVRNLPPEDVVLWVDSLGMRAPKPNLNDVRRVVDKLGSMLERSERASAVKDARVDVLSPRVLPWHGRPLVAAANKRGLRAEIERRLEGKRPVVLVSNPVAWLYVDDLPRQKAIYLRLDDYPRLPGVDPELVGPIEARLFDEADLVVGTARSLLPTSGRAPRRYLPQGVDHGHFAQADLAVPEARVLGFFGLLADWVDYALIEAVARAHPDWVLEFVGPGEPPDALRAVSNLRFCPPVPYAELPHAIGHWRAAWIPFEVSELTRGVNPLKLREYLAAGLPAACTRLPEAEGMQGVTMVDDALAVGRWLDAVLDDDEAARLGRREAMRAHGWDARAATLRAWALEGDA